ncbi:cold-shock protein [Chelativorans alearense]|uniref:cold-shock protein n=1 Tax=Chelativorans alearense TaxID=2681495 RepID=UPI0013D3286E|nr:cold-shock protein [Chelativorans alearense]
MTIGTVKFFNATKGFGFIQPDDGASDVFVHISAVERAGMHTIVEAGRVDFTPLIAREIALSGASTELFAFNGPTPPGVAVIGDFTH